MAEPVDPRRADDDNDPGDGDSGGEGSPHV